MRRRRWVTWLVFALCALLVVDVLGWATWRVLRLERAERLATARADAGRRERLALWQMDSLVSAIIARESARPYFVYRAAYASDKPYENAWETDSSDAVRLSPLATGTGDPLIRLHYQSDGRGILSPQAGTPGMPTRGAADDMTADAAPAPSALRARRLVRELDSIRSRGTPADSVGRSMADAAEMAESDSVSESISAGSGRAGKPTSKTALASPAESSIVQPQTDEHDSAEHQTRAGAALQPETLDEPDDTRLRRQLFDIARNNLEARFSQDETIRVEVGVFRPRWLNTTAPAPGLEHPEPELVFERTVRLNSQTHTQGFWIDWPALRAELLATAVRLVPGAMLDRAPAGPTTASLATIPVSLVSPNPDDSADLAGSTPTRVTLAVTWAATLTALAAIGLVLRAATGLADRRGRFVTAVTHELRSPLTSFRLYTDLLHAGPDDPAVRTRYVDALRRESARLASVVENVLAYAGLASRHAGTEPARLGDMLDTLLPSLTERTTAADAELAVSIEDAAAQSSVLVAPGSLERILTNLIDNACRYGLSPDERTITLTAERGASAVRIRVADRGPGISASDRARIFSEFARGSRAGDDRGVGLGLSLARGLARAEGGDLRLLRQGPPGAAFELRLPIGGPLQDDLRSVDPGG